MKIGFIGLGDQGEPMAEAILDAGYALRVWARRPEVLQKFAQRGAGVAADPADLARDVDQLALCVISEADCREILFDKGALAAMKPGSAVVIHATISPASCHDLAAACAEHGVSFLDAPVSGGRIVAQQRKLLLMIGGDEEVFARNEPVFRCYSANVHLLGGAGAGQVAKIINNLLMNLNLTLANYVLEFGQALGLDRAQLRAMLLTGTSQSFALDALDRIVLPGKIRTVLAEKDLGFAIDLANAHPEDQAAQKIIQLAALALEGRRHLAGQAA